MGSILNFITIKKDENELHQKITFQDTTPINVFTDGACSNNGKSNARAGIGIYFGKNDKRNVSERIWGKQTNNVAELKAIIKVYEILKNEIDIGEKLNIYSDSIYAIRCCGEYGLKMKRENWKNKKGNIANHELVEEAFELYHNKSNISLIHIKAHTNKQDELSIGNANADKLATEATNKSI